ncbi:MAG: IS1595 family transposase [Xanthobacteraceae bacterium]|nr:IS1595 family transposase [Xanthobacteraceae bacterium]
MAATLSVRQFFQRFPDEEACLAHVMEVRHGLRHVCRACSKEATFHRITGRKAFACAQCGDHVYPSAGTIFQDSRTPLQLWFYAIFLFVTTRHGVSSRELQRQLGVTLKTAWRMGHKIRELTGRADMKVMLNGHVEIDETYVGGRANREQAFKSKTIVMGLKKRGGRLHTEVIPNTKMTTFEGVVTRQVYEGSTISTDEHLSYGLLNVSPFKHETVNHGSKEYARGEVHVNSVESFWRIFKLSIASTHIHISKKHFDSYLREFTFRSNHRARENAMFDLLVASL